MYRKFVLLLALLFLSVSLEAKLPDLTPQIVHAKLEEIMKAHATHKSLTPLLVKRAMVNFAEELDPTKTYFLESDIDKWINPSEELQQQIIDDYQHDNYREFYDMYDTMLRAINRRHQIEKLIDENSLPKHVNPDEFKDPKWVSSDQELLTRLMKIKALQLEATSKLKPPLKEKSLQRIVKRQAKYEEELLNADAGKKQNLILSKVLKAISSSLDTHTAYFTPDEANQFMINVQQRLFGIGAQLRDDINGFTVIKIIDGSPASLGKQLKVKDRIIAINGEPVVGMDIIDAVELIRGEENTSVVLTVIREEQHDKEDSATPPKEEMLDITIIRGEVVLKESRYEVTYEPFGSGVIAYLKLFSFYQDPDSASATDLARELKKLQDEHKVLGVILDLRFNSGGMLSQAVAVTGLFITKGIVVSIKDDDGKIQHLRDLDGKTAWDGPLIVLINRASASASEIVAQTLQDYGRALIIGDDHSYGKGSFQTFTLNSGKQSSIDPHGEYKVTRGRYYTVSGKSPQLIGVTSDIVVPGPLSESEIGEKFAKYPLETESISPNFEDDLADIPVSQRDKVASLYRFNLQPRLKIYNPYLETLKNNSQVRLQNNKNYQSFLKELKKKDKEIEEEDDEHFGQNDLQLNEAYNIMKDLIMFIQLSQPIVVTPGAA